MIASFQHITIVGQCSILLCNPVGDSAASDVGKFLGHAPAVEEFAKIVEGLKRYRYVDQLSRFRLLGNTTLKPARFVTKWLKVAYCRLDCAHLMLVFSRNCSFLLNVAQAMA
ncbi:hypothetical protein ASE26_11110 [Duganella sp. Root198D2]|nr:hypothetical protein ASE26_11110 [Duganella sp. Root198D2]